MKLIKLLDNSHDRDNFDCGSEPLNRYLQQTARQHNKKGISRTFVLVDSEQPLYETYANLLTRNKSRLFIG